jgi:hypothetical protein
VNERLRNRLEPVLGYLRRACQRWPGLGWTLIAVLSYTMAAIVITYPLILNLFSSVAGRGDCYEYVWVLWRVKQVVSGSGGGLAYLPWINHPVGLYHPFMLTMLTVDLTALPLLLILPPHVVYNLLILSGFVLCGLSAYWFAVELTGNRQAGLIAGFVFGFFLDKTGHAIGGHLPQTLAYWTPLFALLLWRVVWKPGWRGGLLCGLVLVPTLLVHPIHVVYFVLPVTLAILFYALVQLGRGFFEWKRLWTLLAFGLAALVVVPIWCPSISAEWNEGYLSVGGTIKHSTDLLAFFTPSPDHPILKLVGWPPGYTKRIFPGESILDEGLAYPGLLASLLGIWALVKCWRHTWIWGMLAAICLTLSLGPILKVGGEPVVYTVDGLQTNVVLPYALVKSLPLFGASRTPGRINETVSFSLAVLAAFGFGALTRRSAKQWVSLALAAALAIGIVFESLVRWPLPLRTAEVSSVVRAIAAEDGTGALLHVPPVQGSKAKYLALYSQTVHERPIVGGWVHRHLPEVEPWETTLVGLVKADQAAGDIVPRLNLTQRRAWLRYFDIDYIVLDKTTEEDVSEYSQLIDDLIGAAAYEDESLTAFAVPTDVASPSESFLYTMGEKWTAPFQNQSGTWLRSVKDSGQIYVYATEAQQVRILFTVDSPPDLIDLELSVDGVSVGQFVVGERSTYFSHSLAWEQGMHTIRFTRAQRDGGPLSEGGDDRAFTLESVRVVNESDVPEEAVLDVNLADLIHLTGYALDTSAFRAGGTLTVTLNWRASASPTENFVVFTHLLNEDGVLVAQWDAEPAGGRFPTSAWPEGSPFSYSVSLQLPADLPPGDYRLLVGMYRWPSLERLPVLSDVPGAQDNVIELGTVRVAP